METRAGQIGYGSVDVIQDKAPLRLIPAVNKSCPWGVYLSPTGEDSGSIVSSRCDRIRPCSTSPSARGSNASAPVWQQLP